MIRVRDLPGQEKGSRRSQPISRETESKPSNRVLDDVFGGTEGQGSRTRVRAPQAAAPGARSQRRPEENQNGKAIEASGFQIAEVRDPAELLGAT